MKVYLKLPATARVIPVIVVFYVDKYVSEGGLAKNAREDEKKIPDRKVAARS